MKKSNLFMRMTRKTSAITKAAVSLSLLTGVILLAGSCSKAAPDDAANFAGSYTGAASCFNTTTTVAIAKNGNSSITVPATIGIGSCVKQIGVVVNVSGDNIVPSTTTVIDNCSNSLSLTISGSVSGNTLTLYYTETGSSGTINCSYAGTK